MDNQNSDIAPTIENQAKSKRSASAEPWGEEPGDQTDGQTDRRTDKQVAPLPKLR